MWDGGATQNAGDALRFASESNEARRARGQRVGKDMRGNLCWDAMKCIDPACAGCCENCDETEELQRTAAPSASANDSDENDDDVAEAALLAKMREARVNGRKSGS